MGFTAAVASCYLRFLTFSGRAPRSEYWWFIVFQLLMATASVVGMMLWLMPGGQPDTSKLAYLQTAEANIVYLVFWALLYIPGLSVTVRRLHDIDRSGWWFWIVLVPLLGPIILLIFMVLPGSAARNSFGPDPLGRGTRHPAAELYDGAAYTPAKTRKNKPQVRLPRGMTAGKSEAERRAEILEYYRKNVTRQPT